MATKTPEPQSPDGYKLPAKKGIPKWLLWLGGVGAVLGLLALAAPFFIPWDKLKDQATAQVSKSLGRELKIGKVELSLFTGVHIKDVSLANAKGGFSEQPLFSVADAKVNVSFLSLLSGKVVINSITFIKPMVLIETNSEGLSNLKNIGTSAGSAQGSVASKEKEEAKPLDLVVASLVIQDGDIIVRDKQKKTETAVHGLQFKLLGLSLAAAGGSQLELALEYVTEGKKIPVTLSSNFKLDLASDSVEIRSLEAKAPAMHLSGKGKVLHFSAKPAVDADVEAEVDLGKLADLLPPSILKQLPTDMKSQGVIKLSVQAQADGPKTTVAAALTAARLDLDPLIAIALAPDTPEEAAAKAESMKDLSVPDMSSSVPAGLDLKLKIEIEQMSAKSVKTGKLKVQVALKDRKLASALDLDLYEGQLWARINADMNKPGPLWDGQVGVNKLQFKPLMDDLAASSPKDANLQDLKGKVDGSFTLKTDLKGKGFKRSLRLRNLLADGSFQMKDGAIRKTDMQERLAAQIPHAETAAFLREEIRFANARGDFSYGANKATLKSFALGSGEDWRGGDLFLQAVGFMELGKTVDFKVVPHFNPAKVHVGGEVGNAFKDSAGWFTYDYIAYYGPSMKQAKADFSAGIKKAAKQAVQQQVEKVKEKAQEAVKEKAGDLLKQLPGGLKNLFGQ